MNQSLADKIASRCTFIGEGSYRKAYLSPNKKWVYKIAKRDCDTGNCNEAQMHQKHKQDPTNNIPVAACRLLQTECYDVLIMEYVKVVEYPNNLPAWTEMVDCCQVGINRKGCLVAYDV